MLSAALWGHHWGLGANVAVEVVYTVTLGQRVRACLWSLSAMGYKYFCASCGLQVSALGEERVGGGGMGVLISCIAVVV